MKYIILALCLCCCKLYFLPDWAKPNGTMIARTMPKGGSHAFVLGWHQGCTSSLGTFTHDFNKQFYGWEKDIRFEGYKYGDSRDLFEGHEITDDDKTQYSTGWNRAYGICKHHMLAINRGSPDMRPWIPSQPNYGQLHGLDNIYELSAWGNTAGQGAGWFANW